MIGTSCIFYNTSISMNFKEKCNSPSCLTKSVEAHMVWCIYSHMTWYEDIDKELIFKVHYVAGWLSSELFITTCSQQSFDNLKNHTITVWTLYTYTSCTWKILEKYSTVFELWSNELQILHHIHSTSFIVCAIILLDLFIDLFIQRRKTL